MQILVTGSTGMVGSALVPTLAAAGHQITRVKRDGSGTVPFSMDVPEFEQAEGVIHLAGENIAAVRWTSAHKANIRDSRVQGTRWLCEALARRPVPPRWLLCASAVGYYGSRGDERLTETSAPGEGFLAEVGQAWEAAAAPAIQRGIRVVHLRFGMILSRTGGALAKMLPPFRFGLGGVIGRGRQYWSWVALDDVVGAIRHVIATDALRGPVNVVAPHAVTNAEFTTALGRALHRPTILPVPAFAARIAFGEMADELLLASTRVEPAQLLATGYPYRCPTLDGALRHLLG